MAKTQYKFNPDDLKYRSTNSTLGSRLRRGVIYVSLLLVAAVLLNVFYSLFFDTPRERMIQRENQMLEEQHHLLSERKRVVDTVMQEVNRIDEDIYRVIFESEPPRMEGVKKDPITYQQLLQLSDREVVQSSAILLDTLITRNSSSITSYDLLLIRGENKTEMLQVLPAIQPIENPELTLLAAGFGHRIHPIYKISRMHEGVDYTVPVGTPVRATGQGVVSAVTWSSRGLGNRVVVDHSYGYKTVYACLDKIEVRRGQRVERGQLIAEVGESGLEVAPHLHYEVRLNDVAMNPVNYFFLELDPASYDHLIELSMISGVSFD